MSVPKPAPNKGVQAIKAKFFEIVRLLESHGEFSSAQVATITRSDKEFEGFLKSNELWGGAGSIADQGLMSVPEAHKVLCKLLAELGELQLAAGVINSRTAMWVQAFRQWERDGII